MNLKEILATIITPALDAMPRAMDTVRARCMLLAIGLQESRFLYRKQLGDGPARGFWQFELGTQQSRGGVWGVYMHPVSRPLLEALCLRHRVQFVPRAIWQELEVNDVFACSVARLLLWVDAFPLPGLTDTQGAWELYALRTWRPGKPHRDTWDTFYQQAAMAVTE